MQSELIDQLAKALAAAQGQIKNPPRNQKVTVVTRTGGKYEFQYADHAAIIDAIKKPLSDNGIGYIQYVEQIEDKFRLITMLLHESGQWVSAVNPLFLTPQKDRDGNVLPPSSQDFGSAVTYMKRYALAAMTGVAADSDDDANMADGNAATPVNKVFGPVRTQQEVFPKPKVQPPSKAAEVLVDIASHAGANSGEVLAPQDGGPEGRGERSPEGTTEMTGQAWRRFSEKAIAHAKEGGSFTPEQQQKMSLMKVQAPKTWEKMAKEIAAAQMSAKPKATNPLTTGGIDTLAGSPPMPHDDPDAYRVWLINQMSHFDKQKDLKDFGDIQRPLWAKCFPPDIEDWEALFAEREGQLK